MSNGSQKIGYFSMTDTGSQSFETTNYAIITGLDWIFVPNGPVNGPLAAQVEYQLLVKDGSGGLYYQLVFLASSVNQVFQGAIDGLRLCLLNAGLSVTVTRLAGAANTGYLNGSVHYEVNT